MYTVTDEWLPNRDARQITHSVEVIVLTDDLRELLLAARQPTNGIGTVLDAVVQVNATQLVTGMQIVEAKHPEQFFSRTADMLDNLLAERLLKEIKAASDTSA